MESAATRTVEACILDGRRYALVTDADGTRRFPVNGVLAYLREVFRDGRPEGLDHGLALSLACDRDLSRHDLARLFMGLGYTVEGLLELGPFLEWTPTYESAATGLDPDANEAAFVIDGVRHVVEDDANDRLAFRGNEVLMALAGTEHGLAGTDELDRACAEGRFPLADYVAYEAMLGKALADTLARPPFRSCKVVDDEGEDVFLPVPGFVAVHAVQECDLDPARDCMGIRALGDEVLYGTPLGDAEYGPLMAYMQRRFGFPSSNGDPLVDICGSWCVSTPDPDLFLFVSPSNKPSFAVFSPYMRPPETKDEYGRYVVSPERQSTLREAYRTALLDLLRPVGIGGDYINALGVVEQGTVLMDYPGHGSDHTFEAEHSPAAAKSLPVDIPGTREWDEMLSMLTHLGDGHRQQGLGRLVAMGRKAILDDVRAGSRNLRILVAAGAVGPRLKTVMEGLDLPQDEVDAAGEVARAFLFRHQEDVTSLKVPDFTEDEAREATRILANLGINAPMLKALRGYRHSCRLTIEFERFDELAESGYPEDALGRNASSVGLADKLRGIGNEALAAEVDRLLAEEDGRHLMEAIVSAYASRKARERAEAAKGTEAG